MYSVICCNSRFEDRVVGRYADPFEADRVATAFAQRLVGREWPEFDANWRYVRVEEPDGTVIRR
jgi:hypothetical protein